MRPPRPTDDAPLGRPLFLLNLKSYPQAVGPGALRLARLLEATAREFGVAAAIAPAPADLGRLAQEVGLPVLAQHADPFPAGARTGYLVPEALRAAGARGALLNHSEHPLGTSEIRRTCAELKSRRLAIVLCADTVRRTGELARLDVPYLAIEPPELIGGKISVATAKPELVSGAVEAVRRRAPRTLVLCGAGIHDRNDVATALELGASGVLVASAVATAANPRRVLRDLLGGF